MKLKELRQRLLDRLAEELTPAGYRRRQQSFWREAGPVADVLHVAFINHSGDFDVVADVAVRHHAIEEALNAERANLKPREKRETVTVGAELGNLAGVGQQRWAVAAPGDIEPAVAGIMDWFARIGRPFLDRYSSAGELLRVLEEESGEARLICVFPEKRARVRMLLRSHSHQSAV